MKNNSLNKKTPKNIRTLGPTPKRGSKAETQKVRKQQKILQNESY